MSDIEIAQPQEKDCTKNTGYFPAVKHPKLSDIYFMTAALA
jgi:hypothetical protein